MNEDYIQGINKMKKPATKVMAPPGGQTSINLFAGPEEPAQHQVNKCQANRNQSSIFGSPDHVKSQPVSKPSPAAPSLPEQAAPSPAASSPMVSSPTSVPVTDISIAAQGQGTQSKPSTKVMAPPGGKSSINLFG